jgi:nucleolar MIF4G domain-containing protein 1
VEEIKKKSKLFKNKDKDSEIKLEFNKNLIGLLNKTSEGNIAIIFDEYNRLIDTYTQKIKDRIFFFEKISNITIKLILDQDIINMNITGCICAFISILHFKLGNNFFIYFLQKLIERFYLAMDFIVNNKDENWDFTHNKNIIKNFVFVIIHFYIFGNLTSKFYFDIIKLFIDKLNNITSEMLLLLLRHIGIEIRKENAEIIKEIVLLVNKKYNSLIAEEKLNSNEKPLFENKKLKFIVEMIDDIKNNKFLKFNLLEKFSFLKTFVSSNMKNFEHTDSSIDCFKIDLSIDQINSYDITKKTQNDSNSNNDKKQDLLMNLDDELIDDANIINTDKLNKMFKKYKINTDLKKKIFTAIVTGADYLDTFEKLMRLNLSNEQSRDIIKIIVLLIVNEKCFNQFYFILLKKLIQFNKDNKYTYHFTIWDQLKMMDNFELKSVHSLAKTTASLLNEEIIGLPCLLNFEFENSNEKQFLFILLIFDKYFEISNTDKTKILFAKLVKNDNHVEFGKKLFAYLAKQFIEDIDFTKKTEVKCI